MLMKWALLKYGNPRYMEILKTHVSNHSDWRLEYQLKMERNSLPCIICINYSCTYWNNAPTRNWMKPIDMYTYRPSCILSDFIIFKKAIYYMKCQGGWVGVCMGVCVTVCACVSISVRAPISVCAHAWLYVPVHIGMLFTCRNNVTWLKWPPWTIKHGHWKKMKSL